MTFQRGIKPTLEHVRIAYLMTMLDNEATAEATMRFREQALAITDPETVTKDMTEAQFVAYKQYLEQAMQLPAKPEEA